MVSEIENLVYPFWLITYLANLAIQNHLESLNDGKRRPFNIPH